MSAWKEWQLTDSEESKAEYARECREQFFRDLDAMFDSDSELEDEDD